MDVLLDDKVKSVLCPVKPEHVDAGVHFFGAFDEMDTEITAHHIVLLCQWKGDWFPFTDEEIQSFYRSGGQKDRFTFDNLIKGGWIHPHNGKYYLTLEFVARVWMASPAL